MLDAALLLATADAAALPLGDGVVHTVCCSPPYFSLRRYAGEQERDWPGVIYSPMPGMPKIRVKPMRCALGLEPDPAAYIGHMVLVMRECWRVLRDDGVAWLVMGDSFSNQGDPEPAQTKWQVQGASDGQNDGKSRSPVGLSAGNLLLIPHRLALALQSEGWVVRNDCVWSKKAPMPSSVAGWRWQKHRIKVSGGDRGREPQRVGAFPDRPQQDHNGKEFAPSAEYVDCPGCARCSETGGYVLRRGSWRHTRAHETVLMLTKGMGYWSDQERVREAHSRDWGDGKSGGSLVNLASRDDDYVRGSGYTHRGNKLPQQNPAGRNPRSVFHLASEPYPKSHYAVYPTALIAPLIRASCPTRCCPVCGQGWAPVVEKTESSWEQRKSCGHKSDRGGSIKIQKQLGATYEFDNRAGGFGTPSKSTVLGYRPSCGCGAEGLECDGLEFIATPTGTRTLDDPSLFTGRAGFNRPREPDEGCRLITRYEQRRYAEQLKQSTYRDEMEQEAGSAFAHYIRKDKSGARPAPQYLLDAWIDRGWIEKVTLPEMAELEPIPGLVLDPFVGSGTTLAVARELGLRGVGLDLSHEYIDQQAKVRAGVGAPSGALDDLPMFQWLEEMEKGEA